MSQTDSLALRLFPILDPLQHKIKDWHCHIVPSAFNPIDPNLRALPLASEWRWVSAQEHIKRFAPETVILQMPVFWQLEPFIYFAVRGAEAPICIIEPQNYPLDKAAVRFASANAIVAEAAEAAAITEYLHAGQIELPPYWIVVHAGDAVRWDTPPLLKNKKLEIAEEVHLAPGVPLLVQCDTIVAAQSGQYHHSDLFIWNDDHSAPAISTTGSLLFTLKDFALPFALEGKGACACGKTLLARAA